MALNIPVEMRDAILAGGFHPVMLVYVDWPGGAVRVHSGVGELTWDGHTWTGVRGFGFVSLPVVARGIGQETGLLQFGGLDAVIDQMVGADSAGAQVQAWFGVLTERTPAPLLTDPVRMFTGTIDDAGDTISADASSRQGQLTIVSGPSQMSGGSPTHTFEDQQLASAGDTAGRWVRTSIASATANVPTW
ncbi:MAG: hypothetical protein CML69_15615 [Rhodobacteraceae bacterium]|nr:hypothetical protein [Paracoccaceae bacterium]